MREIKYRAWDIENQQMLYPDGVYGPYQEPNTTIICELLADAINDQWGADELTESFELMEFTGLYDRRDKPVYEGDIVLFDKGFYEIAYFPKFGMFGMVGKSNYKKFTRDEPMGSGGSSTKYKPYVLNNYYQRRIEVIGHIHVKSDVL